MAKYLDQIEPQTFKDSPKATHFTQDYVIVCEKDLLVSSLGQGYGIFQTPGGPPAGFNNAFAPWWIQAFDTHGGIPTLDPFRAKTLRFWMATRDNASPDVDTIIKPSKINTEEQYHYNNFSGPLSKGGLHVQRQPQQAQAIGDGRRVLAHAGGQLLLGHPRELQQPAEGGRLLDRG